VCHLKKKGMPIEVRSAHSTDPSVVPTLLTTCVLDIDIHRNEPKVEVHERAPNTEVSWRKRGGCTLLDDSSSFLFNECNFHRAARLLYSFCLYTCACPLLGLAWRCDQRDGWGKLDYLPWQGV
jgi:hypothetical protein